MTSLQKKAERNFRVLNLTDPQISLEEYQQKHPRFAGMVNTVRQLVEQTQPDLITCTGDFSYNGSLEVYRFYGEFFGSFGIPWAFVWGNHDNQDSQENVLKAADILSHSPNCIFEYGDAAMGNGNYVIGIQEGNNPIAALIMMDTHNVEPLPDGVTWSYSKLNDVQMRWYREQITMLKQQGYPESALFIHIPIYEYRRAVAAAYRHLEEQCTLEDSYTDTVWNDGYQGAFGVMWEDISSYEEGDGVFPVLKQEAHTKLVIAGHNHNNNFCIPYEGIKLVFSLKTGPGSYYEPALSGGTVIEYNNSGLCELYHVYIR